MIPPVLFPVLKEHGEGPALGYVVARSVEVVLLLPAAIGPLVLVATSARVRSPDDTAHFDTVRMLIQTYDMWGYAGSAVFFCLSVLLLNSLLYRSRLVPRWISVWALVAVVPYLAELPGHVRRAQPVLGSPHPSCHPAGAERNGAGGLAADQRIQGTVAGAHHPCPRRRHEQGCQQLRMTRFYA